MFHAHPYEFYNGQVVYSTADGIACVHSQGRLYVRTKTLSSLNVLFKFPVGDQKAW